MSHVASLIRQTYEARHRGATWINQIRDSYSQESINVEKVGKSKSWLNVPFA